MKRKRYTEGFKREPVIQMTERGYSQTSVIENLGISGQLYFVG